MSFGSCRERQAARNEGIDPDRIIFADKLPKEHHLARLGLADLALDTRIVNGAATTSDALWAGVPVLAIRGTHFASRMSASILVTMGLEDLVSESIESYVAQAVRLCRSAQEFSAVKKRVASNRAEKPLFNTTRFARNLEKAYSEMMCTATPERRRSPIFIQ